MEKKIKIVSNGKRRGTYIMFGESKLMCVTKIEIDPIVQGKEVSARLTVEGLELELDLKKENVRTIEDEEPGS